jgi:hypothetical protein
VVIFAALGRIRFAPFVNVRAAAKRTRYGKPCVTAVVPKLVIVDVPVTIMFREVCAPRFTVEAEATEVQAPRASFEGATEPSAGAPVTHADPL